MQIVDHSHPQLCAKIRDRILAEPSQRIPFAAFMEMALYDPEYGYYATNYVNIGSSGDFYTAPHLGADFGELLAEQFAEMWARLNYPNPFTLVEIGAGQGLLVRDILRYLHRHHDACFDAVEYVVVEQSAALVAQQQQRMAKLVASFERLHWRTWDEIAIDSIVGCLFSNELVDALPVHWVTQQDGQLKEIYVTLADATEKPLVTSAPMEMEVDLSALWYGAPAIAPVYSSTQFAEVLAEPSTPELQRYFSVTGIDFPSAAYCQGYRTEVNLAALDWMQTVASRLRRGYVLTIDYGYLAQRYYLPSRSGGTLQCYYQHQYHSNPYIHVGRQDITAHVNFSALQQQGDRHELETLGFTQQGLFLMALGMGDRIANISQLVPDEKFTVADILARREGLHSLIHPNSLGGFGVLIQGKGLEPQMKVLKGLQTPELNLE
ncbi:class I SAM-dependent methyltransferase [Leptolyngbya sp. AN02str]|uniref:class I SAM-dependent methyltransferase n=1 Tax=Leptolyngbya sp. AN02str TaxID=3423363 RepID=UPI003D310F9B